MAQQLTELEQIELQIKKIQLEKEKLALEMTIQQVEDYKRKKFETVMDRTQRGQDLKKQTEERRALQRKCYHKQGGNGLAQMHTSTESRYAVSKFILPTNEMIVRCHRCKKEWFPPNPKDYMVTENGQAKMDKPAYQAAWDEYIAACRFDSGMAVGSSTTTFNFVDGQARRDATHEFIQGFKTGAI